MRKYIAIGVLAIAVGVAGTACKDSKQGPTETPKLQVCATSPVTVGKDEKVPCDLKPPQKLDITGMSEAECVDAGGKFDLDGICRGVNY